MSNLIDSATDVAIFATDEHGIITVFNSGAEELLGYRADEVITKCTPLHFLDDFELNRHAVLFSTRLGKKLAGIDIFRESVEHGIYTPGEWTMSNKDGANKNVHLTINAIHSEGGDYEGLLFLAAPVAKNRMVDDLTELPDKHVFDIVFEREFRRLQRTDESIALIRVSVDNLENVKQNTSEDYLRTIALILTERIQRAGDLLAYTGDNEFSVVLPSTDKSGTVKLAEQLRLLVDDGKIHNGDPQANILTLSIGIGFCKPSETDSANDLIKQADCGLSSAKISGGNCSRIG